MLRNMKCCAADPGSMPLRMGPGSAEQREERCAACGTRDVSVALCNDLERAGAAERLRGGNLLEIRRLARDRPIEQDAVAPARDFDGAKGAQMLGDILGVEQLESARDQPRHQMHQRHLRGVAGAMEHALAEKRASEADTI